MHLEKPLSLIAFSVFLGPSGGPRAWKSSKNAIKVCEKRGSFLFTKTSFLQQMYQTCLAEDSTDFRKTTKSKRNEKLVGFVGCEKRAANNVFYILDCIGLIFGILVLGFRVPFLTFSIGGERSGTNSFHFGPKLESL